MERKWRSIGWGIFAALMLTACGAARDEVQSTEQKNIEEKSSEADHAEFPAEEMEALEKETDAQAGETEAAVVSIETDTKEYKDSDKIILVTSYNDVTVSIEGNEAAAQAVTDEFAKRKKAFEEGLKLEDTLEEARENPIVDGELYYYEDARYSVERNDGKILSFCAMWSDFKGGAHGQYVKYGVNFDAATGRLLTIADIALDKAAFQEICVQEMLRQCEDLKAQGVLFEEEMIMPSLEEVLAGKMEGDEWYFTMDGLRFVSNIYEIAPYAAGNIDFDIPYEMVNEALKEEYRG